MNQPQPPRHGPKPKQRPTSPARQSWQLRALSDFPLKPTLTVMKFDRPNKSYRLIWKFTAKAFLCKENQMAYGKVYGKGGVLEAGETLAGLLGVRFER